jgi:hypothetical protein
MNGKQKLARAKSFVAQNDLKLQQATMLIGGAPALLRLQRLRRKLQKDTTFLVSHRHGLQWLRSLLSLENLYEDNDEFFMAISPNDPIIWMFCELTEAMDKLLYDLGSPNLGSASALSAAA